MQMRKNTILFFLLSGIFLAMAAIPQTSYAFWCGEKTKPVPMTKNDYFAPRIQYCDCWWFRGWRCKNITVGKKMITASGRHFCAYIKSADEPDTICAYLVNLQEKCKVNEDGTRRSGQGPKLVDRKKGKCQPRMLAPLPPPFCEPIAPIEVTAEVIPEDNEDPTTMIPGNSFFTPKVRVLFTLPVAPTDVNVTPLPIEELLAARDEDGDKIINDSEQQDADKRKAEYQKTGQRPEIQMLEMNHARDVNGNRTIEDSELYGNAQYVDFNNKDYVVLGDGQEVKRGDHTYQALVEDSEICVYRKSDNTLTEKLVGCDARRDYMPKPNVAMDVANSSFETPRLIVSFPGRPPGEYAVLTESTCDSKTWKVEFCLIRDPINNLACVGGYSDENQFYVKKGTQIPYPIPTGYTDAVPYNPESVDHVNALLAMEEEHRCVDLTDYRLCLQPDAQQRLWIVKQPLDANVTEADEDPNSTQYGAIPYDGNNAEQRAVYEAVTTRPEWKLEYEVRSYSPNEMGLCAPLPPKKE